MHSSQIQKEQRIRQQSNGLSPSKIDNIGHQVFVTGKCYEMKDIHLVILRNIVASSSSELANWLIQMNFDEIQGEQLTKQQTTQSGFFIDRQANICIEMSFAYQTYTDTCILRFNVCAIFFFIFFFLNSFKLIYLNNVNTTMSKYKKRNANLKLALDLMRSL